jgi:hypothetical protein
VVSVPLADGERTRHHFQIVAPALGSRHDVLTAEHLHDMPYPVTVGAACFSSLDWDVTHSGYSPGLDPETGERWITAPTELTFRKLVQQVFASPEVQSLIDSLIARSNEVQAVPREEKGD